MEIRELRSFLHGMLFSYSPNTNTDVIEALTLFMHHIDSGHDDFQTCEQCVSYLSGIQRGYNVQGNDKIELEYVVEEILKYIRDTLPQVEPELSIPKLSLKQLEDLSKKFSKPSEMPPTITPNIISPEWPHSPCDPLYNPLNVWPSNPNDDKSVEGDLSRDFANIHTQVQKGNPNNE